MELLTEAQGGHLRDDRGDTSLEYMNLCGARRADLVEGLQPYKISRHKHLRPLVAQGLKLHLLCSACHGDLGWELRAHQEALEGLVTSTPRRVFEFK